MLYWSGPLPLWRAPSLEKALCDEGWQIGFLCPPRHPRIPRKALGRHDLNQCDHSLGSGPTSAGPAPSAPAWKYRRANELSHDRFDFEPDPRTMTDQATLSVISVTFPVTRKAERLG
jgi:hypothetical protein